MHCTSPSLSRQNRQCELSLLTSSATPRRVCETRLLAAIYCVRTTSEQFCGRHRFASCTKYKDSIIAGLRIRYSLSSGSLVALKNRIQVHQTSQYGFHVRLREQSSLSTTRSIFSWDMPLLKFTLSEEGVRTLRDALACLGKFSEEISLEATKDKVCTH
jgi:hypothetical protein